MKRLCYYLGSRFYSPRLGRFLNADKHFDTGTGVLGTNVYVYCNNNPVMHTDPTGEILTPINLLETYAAIIVFGYLFLKMKGYDISAEMYLHAFNGHGRDLYAKTKRLIIKEIIKSPQYLSLLDQITKLRVSSINNWCRDVEFTSGDLYYSIQHVTIRFSGRKDRTGRWTLEVYIADTYDFTEFRLINGVSLGNAANDMGVVLQRLRLLTPYNWYVRFNQNVKYVRNGVIYS